MSRSSRCFRGEGLFISSCATASRIDRLRRASKTLSDFRSCSSVSCTPIQGEWSVEWLGTGVNNVAFGVEVPQSF